MLPKTHFMIEPFVSKLKSLHSNVEIAITRFVGMPNLDEYKGAWLSLVIHFIIEFKMSSTLGLNANFIFMISSLIFKIFLTC